MKRKPKVDDTARTTDTRREVASLKDHPRQAELFDDMPDGELQLLADSLTEIGLKHPIEILPDGTIIAGHQRVRAAKLLKWIEIDVVVRHDLKEAGTAAIEEHLIRDNLERRQLDLVAIARCYAKMRENKRFTKRGDGDLRDQLADRFGKSGRSLDRYVKVLKAPRPVQSAVSAGTLPLVMATEIAGLPVDEQEQIAAAIVRGDAPKAAAKEYLRRPEREHRLADDALAGLARNLKRAADDLRGRLDEITPDVLVANADILKSAKSLIDHLLKGAKPKKGMTKPDNVAGIASTLKEFRKTHCHN